MPALCDPELVPLVCMATDWRFAEEDAYGGMLIYTRMRCGRSLNEPRRITYFRQYVTCFECIAAGTNA